MAVSHQKGIWKPLSPARKMISDMLHFACQTPSIPVARTMHLSSVVAARRKSSSRPSWTAIFMKAFAIIARRHVGLRQAYVRWPWAHLYEHPQVVCAVAVERQWQGEQILLNTQIRNPDQQSLDRITEYLASCKEVPIEEIGYFRTALRIGRLPQPIRRFIWWTTIHMSGFKRAKRLGTFGVSSYGRLGAEQIHPIAPLTTVLTFGPISEKGEVVVRIVYDHRVLDGANVARHLAEMEQVLLGEIVQELENGSCEVPLSRAG